MSRSGNAGPRARFNEEESQEGTGEGLTVVSPMSYTVLGSHSNKDYHKNAQFSSKDVRLFCKPCDVKLESKESYERHINGKKHKSITCRIEKGQNEPAHEYTVKWRKLVHMEEEWKY